jgi:hypothetical protein
MKYKVLVIKKKGERTINIDQIFQDEYKKGFSYLFIIIFKRTVLPIFSNFNCITIYRNIRIGIVINIVTRSKMII